MGDPATAQATRGAMLSPPAGRRAGDGLHVGHGSTPTLLPPRAEFVWEIQRRRRLIWGYRGDLAVANLGGQFGGFIEWISTRLRYPRRVSSV